nr:Cd(II)/Pb(II)-responsive transcriptional regulator [uncultured Roseateles sp.]
MKIGELSSAAATPIETIRFYEREGLLPAPARTAGNFRIYEAAHLDRLQMIRYCRSLDMSLDEVRALLSFRDKPAAACGDVNVLLDRHIQHVSTRIEELRLLERQLMDLRRQCGDERTAQDCGILAGMKEAVLESSHSPEGVRRPGRDH